VCEDKSDLSSKSLPSKTFVSYRNNIIKEVKNDLQLRMMILQIQEACRFLKGSLATNQYEETSQVLLIRRRL
jgi:hypothetical protein